MESFWLHSKGRCSSAITINYNCIWYNTKGCLKRGKATLFCIGLAEAFHIEIGDIYRTFAEIRLSKEPTKFLLTLKTLLEAKISEDLK